MGDETNEVKNESIDSNVINIDKFRVERLKQKGHLGTMLEEYEILKLKLLYDQDMNKQEATKLVTLTKYFIEHGPTEAYRLSCKLLYQKYMEPYNL